jgi:hypothetical protein
MKKTFLAVLILFITDSLSAQTLLRGPYLQAGSPTSMVIRWRTEEPTNTRLRFGPTANDLNQTLSDDALVNDHEVKISGLSPKTRYFYSIGTSAKVIQGDAGNYFETHPQHGQPGKYRFGVFGDCGTNSAIQGNTRDQLSAYLGNNYLNAWLLLGDNAYGFGTDTEYQSNFFNHYKDSFMKRSPLYPTPGNHDYSADNPERQMDHDVPYYKIFTMPSKGESGGTPSGTEAYYSYDYGNVHFLSLDSYGKEDRATRMYDTLGRQVQWIKTDLDANKNKDWIVAYWHHPPYSQGSRNSETEGDMISIRQNLLRILERYGVDLILCGHSHIYERSRLMGGHYDKAATFKAGVHNYSSSSGKYDGSDNSCPYIKEPGTKKGTVYVVSGSSGHLGGTSPDYPHKAMYYSNPEKGGMLFLEVEGNRLDAKWIGEDGQIRDKFTMEKDVNKTKSIDLSFGGKVTLTPSFVGKYNWSTGENTKNITVSPTVSTEYQVKDEFNCVSDVFKVNVETPPPFTLTSFDGSVAPSNLVTLKWTTSLEFGSSAFVVERSKNNKDFVELATVPAAKQSFEEKKYEWKDETSSNIVNQDSLYYRLRMVDANSKFVYSKTIGIKINRINQDLDVEVMPNPSLANAIQVRLTGREQAKGTLTVTDNSGRLRMTRELTLTTKPVTFLPDGTPPGVYFLKFVFENRTFSKKVVVF